jgi:hypothetical protein
VIDVSKTLRKRLLASAVPLAFTQRWPRRPRCMAGLMCSVLPSDSTQECVGEKQLELCILHSITSSPFHHLSLSLLAPSPPLSLSLFPSFLYDYISDASRMQSVAFNEKRTTLKNLRGRWASIQLGAPISNAGIYHYTFKGMPHFLFPSIIFLSSN